MDSSWRFFGSAVGFGFGVVWMTAGLGAAIVSVLFAALGYGVVFTAERAQANAATRQEDETPPAVELALDEFEYEPEPDYETPDAEAPLAAEADYGWPSQFAPDRAT